MLTHHTHRHDLIIPNCHECGEPLDGSSVFGCHRECYDKLQTDLHGDEYDHEDDQSQDDYQLQCMMELEDRHAAEEMLEELIEFVDRAIDF